MNFLLLAYLGIPVGAFLLYLRNDYQRYRFNKYRHEKIWDAIEEYCVSKRLFKLAKKEFLYEVTGERIYEFTKHKDFKTMPNDDADVLIDYVMLLKKEHENYDNMSRNAEYLAVASTACIGYSLITILYYVVN